MNPLVLTSSVGDVAVWLEERGLQELVVKFRAQDMDGEALSFLHESDMNVLGVTTLGHQRKIMAQVELLRQQIQVLNDPPNYTPTTSRSASPLSQARGSLSSLSSLSSSPGLKPSRGKAVSPPSRHSVQHQGSAWNAIPPLRLHTPPYTAGLPGSENSSPVSSSTTILATAAQHTDKGGGSVWAARPDDTKAPEENQLLDTATRILKQLGFCSVSRLGIELAGYDHYHEVMAGFKNLTSWLQTFPRFNILADDHGQHLISLTGQVDKEGMMPALRTQENMRKLRKFASTLKRMINFRAVGATQRKGHVKGCDFATSFYKCTRTTFRAQDYNAATLKAVLAMLREARLMNDLYVDLDVTSPSNWSIRFKRASDLLECLKALVVEWPEGIHESQVGPAFAAVLGYPLNPRQFGYRDLRDVVEKHAEIFAVRHEGVSVRVFLRINNLHPAQCPARARPAQRSLLMRFSAFIEAGSQMPLTTREIKLCRDQFVETAVDLPLELAEALQQPTQILSLVTTRAFMYKSGAYLLGVTELGQVLYRDAALPEAQLQPPVMSVQAAHSQLNHKIFDPHCRPMTIVPDCPSLRLQHLHL